MYQYRSMLDLQERETVEVRITIGEWRTMCSQIHRLFCLWQMVP